MADRNVTRTNNHQPFRPFWGPIYSLRHEMDRLFGDFVPPSISNVFGSRGLHPIIEVKETEGVFAITAELPGIDQKDIQLNLKDNILTLAGEKRVEHNEDGNGRHYTERAFGRFERRIPLDEEVDADKIDAHFANGVLHITLPKNPRAQDKGRHIEIKF
jgi:HSP20 family protein